MIVKALEKIRHNEIVYEKNSIFEVDQHSGEVLIKKKAAEIVEENVDQEDELEKMTVAELKQKAEKLGIDLKATKKDDIIAEIKEVTNEL
ncbi:Rho termination factor N-terminal domain-containing protein [Fusobacterium sp.]|uniref:Rho termination factor N-terminal domain-containing protein n=1 Tax=Fusobacterium sp. TaxID=68766 RepID=UPI002E78A725|nr:Rho termination factor N-terminal domain-containing protein [Fusobacterium sp.]MEE1476544.1 Rho termination factor N-terminal domain-containing protein [Fusobacterium sp.]